MSQPADEQAIAIAGLFQAASLVDQIARNGMVSQDSFEVLIASLFITNPNVTEDVYGGKTGLKYNLSLGFKEIEQIIDKKGNKFSPNSMRYALSLVTLERKLAEKPEFLNLIGKRLTELETKANYFYNTEHDDDPNKNPSRFTHRNVIAGLDALYQETISNFSFRIQVTGDPRHLQNSENSARIRAILFAGIRAAMLWRQVGGKRWHLLFFKGRLRPAIQRLKA